jgi:hypothetical protein
MGADILVFLITLLIMFAPTMIAFNRNLKRRWACFWINLLFGWTIILWIPLIAWSLLTSAIETTPTP